MKENKENSLKTEAHILRLSVVISLLSEEREQYINYCRQCSNESDNRSNGFEQVFPPTTCVPTFIDERATFWSYMYAILILLKHAFAKKKTKHFIAIR